MKPAMSFRQILTRTVAACLLATFSMGGTALAIDQPPQDSDQQRTWLIGHLVTDMEALGTFDGNAFAKVPAIVNSLTDDQVALLAQYYYLTRSKTEQDAALYAMQQQGSSADQVNQAKAEVADLLSTMNEQIGACYNQFAPMPQPVQYLAQICYASVPGWCCHARCFVPDWYYGNGSFVGPYLNAACAGAWAAPVCSACFNHGSHFYTTYYNVAKTVHFNRSTYLAKRQADWLRQQGNWKSLLAHDRFAQQTQVGIARLPAGPQIYAANHNLAVRSPYVPLAHARSSHAIAGNRTVVAHKQVAKPHAPVHQQVKVQQHTAKAHASHTSASHSHAPQPTVHAAHPNGAAHASHSRSAPHSHARASSGGHSKHR